VKIAVVAWRYWSAAHRYRALMENALEEEHEVCCIASKHLSDSDMTMKLLADMGVRGIRGKDSVITQKLDEFDPDAVFGEYRWSLREEILAHGWAAQHNKPSFILDHSQFYAQSVQPPTPQWARSTLLTVNEMAAQQARTKGWEKAVAVGQPEFDLIEKYDDAATREQLRCKEGQPLVALFLEHISGTGSPPSRDFNQEKRNMRLFVKVAVGRGWRVCVHCHAQERTAEGYIYHRGRVPFLKELQSLGATFVTGFLPGTADGIVFEQCHPFELIAAADAVTGSHLDTVMTCYALKKRYFVFYGVNTYGARQEKQYLTYRQEIPAFSTVGKDFSALIEAVEENKGGCKHKVAVTEKWFYALDGNCWRRMLNLVEKRASLV
jgi:hypothetical protein